MYDDPNTPYVEIESVPLTLYTEVACLVNRLKDAYVGEQAATYVSRYPGYNLVVDKTDDNAYYACMEGVDEEMDD